MSTAKIVLTVKAVEMVLQEMIASGERISQYSVEKKAGLSNGALNYKVKEYIDLKKCINLLKKPILDPVPDVSEKDKIKKEQTLKDKYRSERDELKKQNLYLESENKELLFQLFKLQQYIKHLEVDGMADINVVNFSLK